MSADAKPAEKSGAVNEMVEIVKTIVYALAIALVLRVLFFQPFTIPSASMEPNLLAGDYIIVSKFSYGYSRHSIPFSPPIFHGRIPNRAPTRGDIIVFKLPRDGHTDYIKRLIGLPGDRVQVRQGLIYINDKPIQRQTLAPTVDDVGYGYQRPVNHYRETMPNGRSYVTNGYGSDGGADNTGVYVVPTHCYFMMGDNRDNSLDSRFDPGPPPPGAGSTGSCGWDPSLDSHVQGDLGVGFVPEENLVGKAQIILLSWKPGASLFKPWTWVMNLRLSRSFRLLS